MAVRDFEKRFIFKEVPSSPPKSFLPAFPKPASISSFFPELFKDGAGLRKIDFLNWIDPVLDDPDEIWETDQLDEDRRFYYYLSYLEEEGKVPVFAVEISGLDDQTETSNFGLILDDIHLLKIRNLNPFFCRSKEWEKEKVVRALNEKALLKYDQDSLDEARELIDAAIRFSETGSAYLLNNRGLISWKMGRTDQAKSDFLESIELDSANGDPYFNIGLIYFDESNYLKALQYLRRAVEINPFDSQFLTELGHLYLELEREEEALLLFEKAFKNNPGDPQVDFHLGYYFLYKKHDPNNAISYYEKGLRKDPDDQFALADLAIAYWVLGNQSKSSEIHQILKSKSRLMPYTISRMVYLNVEMGDYDTALNYYKKALTEGEPFEPEWLHYNAALVYAKTGRPKLALDILDLAVKAGGDAVIKRAISDKALSSLKRSADFKKLIKQSERK